MLHCPAPRDLKYTGPRCLERAARHTRGGGRGLPLGVWWNRGFIIPAEILRQLHQYSQIQCNHIFANLPIHNVQPRRLPVLPESMRPGVLEHHFSVLTVSLSLRSMVLCIHSTIAIALAFTSRGGMHRNVFLLKAMSIPSLGNDIFSAAFCSCKNAIIDASAQCLRDWEPREAFSNTR